MKTAIKPRINADFVVAVYDRRKHLAIFEKAADFVVAAVYDRRKYLAIFEKAADFVVAAVYDRRKYLAIFEKAALIERRYSCFAQKRCSRRRQSAQIKGKGMKWRELTFAATKIFQPL